MPAAKWFLSLGPNTPPLDAARTVLEARARAVSHYLQSLSGRRNEHPEQVHQLRVATRRFSAALSIFRDFLRSRDYRELRRLTRHVRRSAGTVRDLDVQREIILTRLRNPAHAEFVQACGEYVKKQRIAADLQLGRITRAAHKEFVGLLNRGVANLALRSSRDDRMGENFGSLAHRILKRRAKAIRAASRKDLEDPDRLHQLRIAAKRMRYAMEIFSGCFPVNFRRTHYRAVERLQDELGRINDLRNLLRTINGIGEKVKPVDPSANGEAMVSARDDLSTTVAAELRSQRIRFIRRWTRKSQRLFYQRLKAVLNRPVARTRIRGRAKSKL